MLFRSGRRNDVPDPHHDRGHDQSLTDTKQGHRHCHNPAAGCLGYGGKRHRPQCNGDGHNYPVAKPGPYFSVDEGSHSCRARHGGNKQADSIQLPDFVLIQKSRNEQQPPSHSPRANTSNWYHQQEQELPVQQQQVQTSSITVVTVRFLNEWNGNKNDICLLLVLTIAVHSFFI